MGRYKERVKNGIPDAWAFGTNEPWAFNEFNPSEFRANGPWTFNEWEPTNGADAEPWAVNEWEPPDGKPWEFGTIETDDNGRFL